MMKRNSELGSITSGKLASMILVNGNPTTNISDFRKVDSVIRGGAVLYPREVYSAVEVRGQ